MHSFLKRFYYFCARNQMIQWVDAVHHFLNGFIYMNNLNKLLIRLNLTCRFFCANVCGFSSCFFYCIQDANLFSQFMCCLGIKPMTLELVMWCYNHKKCSWEMYFVTLHASNAPRYEFHSQKMCELKTRISWFQCKVLWIKYRQMRTVMLHWILFTS